MTNEDIAKVESHGGHFDAAFVYGSQGVVSRHDMGTGRDFDGTVFAVDVDQAEADYQHVRRQRQIGTLGE